jgi:hypothetical protein
MTCKKRDALMRAYHRAQDAQARAATAVINAKRPAKHRSALLKFVAAKLDLQARKAEMEGHCIEHGCQL